MTIASFLVGLVGPLMARWLSAMGMSLVVLAGLTASVDQLKSTLMSNLTGWPSTAIQLGGLLGVWEALGMLLGAVTFVITWHATKGFWALSKS